MGIHIANILSMILSMREDLRALGFDRPEHAAAFKHWVLNHGLKEYPALGELLAQQPGEVTAALPFGVNLVGYAFGELGIGEDVRMAARALLTTDVPMTMVNFKPGDDIPQSDQSMAAHVSDNGPYGINLFCMTAEENARHFITAGQGHDAGHVKYAGHYNIGYWPWELSQWPKDWALMLDLVDEVWVSTCHTYEALADICPKPLMHMPMAVDLAEVMPFKDKGSARRHFKLPTAATLYCFSFDLNSSIHRKNPQACVDSFLRAFPKGRAGKNDVGLVIKCHKPKQQNTEWEKLKRLAAHDSRIHIVEGTLPKPELLALYKACDCFLSLHRAEGFGRGIAEALQLGLHVITTGYSGNVDFCKPPYAELVKYQIIPVEPGQYRFGEGQVWADPDVGHAAQLMRRFYENRSSMPTKTDWPEFSAAVIGSRYKKRLEEIRLENPRLFN